MKKLLTLIILTFGLSISATGVFAQSTDPHNLGKYYSNEEIDVEKARSGFDKKQIDEKDCWGFVFRPPFKENGSLPANTQCYRVQVVDGGFRTVTCGVDQSIPLINEQCIVRAAEQAKQPIVQITNFKTYASDEARCGGNTRCASALEECANYHGRLGLTTYYNRYRTDDCIAIKRTEYCTGDSCISPGQALAKRVSAANNLCTKPDVGFNRAQIIIREGVDLGNDYIYSLGAGVATEGTNDSSIAYEMYDSKGVNYILDSTGLPPGKYRAGVWIKSRADFAAKKEASYEQFVCNSRVLTVVDTIELPKISPISAVLEENKATFKFSYSKGEADFEVALGINPDLVSGTYLGFAKGNSDTLVVEDPKKMAQYSCGIPFWWKVSVKGANPAIESDITGPVKFDCPGGEQPEPPVVEDSNGFSGLLGKLLETKATFYFKYSRPGTFHIALSTSEDMINGTFVSLAEGTEGPLVSNNPKQWDQYECNKQYYWQVWEHDSTKYSSIVESFKNKKIFSQPQGVKFDCPGQGGRELTNQQSENSSEQVTAQSTKVKIYTQVGNQESGNANITIQTGQTFNIFAKLAHPLTNNQFVCLPTNGNITIKFGEGEKEFRTVKACEAFILTPNKEGVYAVSAHFTPQDDDPSVQEGSSQISVTVVNPTVPINETPTFQTCPVNVSDCWKGAGCHNNPETQLSANQVCNYNHPEENYQSSCSHTPTSNTYDDGCIKKAVTSSPEEPPIRSITINGQTVGLNDSLPLRLNGTSGQAQTFLIPVVVTYKNNTTKYLTLNFRYNPPQGGEEPESVQNPSQLETCIYSEEPQNCFYGGSRECTGTWQGTAVARQCKYAGPAVEPECKEICNNPPATIEQTPTDSTPSTCDPNSDGPEWQYRGCAEQCPVERWYCAYDNKEHPFENMEGECACSK